MDNMSLEMQKECYGGGAISTVLNTLVRASEFILNLGRALGSSIARMRNAKLCR